MCRLSLDAGYHLLSSVDAIEKARHKRLIFWKLYVLDRGFALSLGKAPAIPEHEICLERPLETEITGSGLFCFNGWIDYAEIQGDIYRQLYSPRAQRAEAGTRLTSAQALAKRLLLLLTNMVGRFRFMRYCADT